MPESESVSDYTHDVFVSYSHQDRGWVADVLVRKLEAGGVNVLLDEDDFEPGAAAVENMANAVKRSRKTLIVLTPEWVESQWTHFEALLATQRDPSGRERRVIPIMRKQCQPPEWVGYRSWLDFADDTRFDQQVNRLIRALKQLTVSADVVKVDPVNEGLRTLADLLREGPVRDALLAFRYKFETISDRIERLADYKYVHDQLHQLQFHCHDAIVRDLPRLETDDDAADALEFYAQTLEGILSNVRRLAQKPTFTRTPLSWIPALERAYAQLIEGVRARKCDVVKKAARAMDSVLAKYPPVIDTHLQAAANELELQDLIVAVTTASDHAHAKGLQGARLEALETAFETMVALDDHLSALVRDHSRWQDADVDMRRVDTTLAADAMELIDTWPDLKTKMARLSDLNLEPWAETLRKEAAHIDEAIAANDERAMTRYFRRYRRQAGTRFFEIDTTLKLQCDELRNAGEPLAALVESLA